MTRRDVGSKRRAVVVLGMHRSGTSALTRAVALCGAALPRHPLEATEHNPKGYGESARIFELHEALLTEAGSAWHALAPVPRRWLQSRAALRWSQRLAEILREEYGDADPLVVKDPRICVLLPLWKRVFDELKIEPLFAIPVRHPAEVAASLHRAHRVPDGWGQLLWLHHVLAAERGSRGATRCFVGYDTLLSDWRETIHRIAALGVDLAADNPETERAVEEWLDPALRHHTLGAFQSGLHPWVRTAYEWLIEALQGQEPAFAPLDRARVEFVRAYQAFQPLLGDMGAGGPIEWFNPALQERVETLRTELGDRIRKEAELARELDRREREVGRREAEIEGLVTWIKGLVERELKDRSESQPELVQTALGALRETQAAELPHVATIAWALAGAEERVRDLEARSKITEAKLAAVERDARALRAERQSVKAELGKLAPLEYEVKRLEGVRVDLARRLDELQQDFADARYHTTLLKQRFARLESRRLWKLLRPLFRVSDVLDV